MKKTMLLLIFLLTGIFKNTQAQPGSFNAQASSAYPQFPMVATVSDSKFPLAIIHVLTEATAAGSGNVYSLTMRIKLSGLNNNGLNYLNARFVACQNFLLAITDYSLNETRSYPDAIITEFTLPELNGASKEIADIILKVKATSVVTRGGDGSAKPASAKTKSLLASNFKMQLGDLPCQRVATISRLIFKNLSPAQQKCDSISDITITLNQVDAQPWRDWFDSRPNGIQRKIGQVQLMTHDMREVEAIFRISEVEIISFSPAPFSTDATQRVTVGLRIGKVDMKF